MEKLDRKIISFFTKVSHKFQRLTGRTNFFLAKLSLGIPVMALMTDLADYFLPYFLKTETNLLGVALSLFVLVVLGISELPKCDRADEAASLGRERTKEIFSLASSYNWRLVWVFIALLSVVYLVPIAIIVKEGSFFDVLSASYGIGVFLFVYLVEVNPLPPGKSKVGEWAKSFLANFQKPIPVPVERPR